ncbi:MAG: putative transcription factor eukaryotic MBF1 [Erysipelotrichaceae bacterium]|nr:MAG: putative transcription factor eukaryotic MBF1 [Erysipelotrichaceae bacterium]
MNSKSIGKFIAARRKELRLTQSQLATKLHVSDGAVSKWERGINYPDIAIIERLADALELSVMELLKGESLTLDPNIHDSVLAALHYSSEVETRIVKKSKQTLRFWQGLLALILIAVIGGGPLLRIYQDQKSAVSYENIKRFVEEENWFGVTNGACDFNGRYFGSSHADEMKLLCITAQEKFARQNLGQLMQNSILSSGEIDTLFVLLKRLGFNFYGSVTYWSGDINTIGTLMMGYILPNDGDIGDLFIDFNDKKVLRIYIVAPFLNHGDSETIFVLFTDQEGILMTYSEAKLEVQKILDKINDQ